MDALKSEDDVRRTTAAAPFDAHESTNEQKSFFTNMVTSKTDYLLNNKKSSQLHIDLTS